jgi:hypothetical protein
MTDPLLVRALVACYPTAWRRRYGPEYAALLADSLPTTSRSALVVDSLRGAFDARLTLIGAAMSSPLTAAIWATGLLTVAGIAFQKLSEHVGGADVRAAFIVLMVAAVVALAGIVAIAAPALVALLHGRSAVAWRYPAIAIVAVGTWFGLLAIAKAIARGHSVHSAANVAGALLIIVAGLAVLATLAWGASATLRRVGAAGPRFLQPAGLTVLAGGMALATVADVAWGIAAQHGHAIDRSHGGVLATPFLPSWLVTIALMAAATALAALACRRQLTTTNRRPEPTSQ